MKETREKAEFLWSLVGSVMCIRDRETAEKYRLQAERNFSIKIGQKNS